jgi:undecaprenyl-diphosphatase
VVRVVNPASGSGPVARHREVRRELPKAEIIELARNDNLEEGAPRRGRRAEVLGTAVATEPWRALPQ